MAVEKPLFLDEVLGALQNQQLTTLTFQAIQKKVQDLEACFKTTAQQSWSGHKHNVLCVALLADGRVVSGSCDRTLKVWDVKTGTCMQTSERTSSHYTDYVFCVALLADGRVVSGSYKLKVWDMRTGTCVQTLSGHTEDIFCVAMLPDGWVVSGSRDETLKVWDVTTGTCVQTLRGHTNAVACVAVLPDGWVISGSWDKTLKVWDVKMGTCVQTLRGHTNYVGCVVVLPDEQVISGSFDDTLKVWDVKTGTCVQTLKGHTKTVNCIALLPDGRMISGSRDETLKVWNVKTGKCVQTVSGHTYDVHCVVVLPDGQVVSGGGDNTLKVWEPEEKLLIVTLTPQDHAILLTAVQNNTSLTYLNLSQVALADIPQGINWLKAIVEKHPLLERLDLSETGLTDAMFHKFFPILCARKCIEELNVEGNPLLSQAAKDQVKAYQASLKTPLFPSPPIHTTPDKVPELPKPVMPILMPISQPQPIIPPAVPQKNLPLPFALQKITWQSLTLGKLIGSGGYGDVYEGQWLGIPVAIKQLHLKTLSTPLSVEFEHEASIMAQCQFPHIVRLYGVCDEPGHTAMVMEYLPKGSLCQVLQDEKDPLPWNPVRWNIAIDVGKGLLYLHGQNIIHRDLKSLNVLLDQQYQARIGDFGLSKVKLQSSSTAHKTQKGIGTTRWMAPELFSIEDDAAPSPNQRTDIYSYGMVLWEIASRMLPFKNAQNDMVVMSWIMQGKKEKIPQDCPKLYGAIIEQCWEVADKRPTAQAVTNLLTAAKPEAPAPILKPESKPYLEKSWHFDPLTERAAILPMNKDYALLPATPKDIQKVIGFYQHHPLSHYEVSKVEVIYNRDFNQAFQLHLSKLQKRHNNPAFVPQWQGMSNANLRQSTIDLFAQLTQPYTDPDYPAVKLLPAWHGTKPQVLDSIFSAGYANLATTDAGFFGKGYYSAYEAEYSYRVYSQGALILNWIASFSPLPVVDQDMKTLGLEGKSNYGNYDAHFVPVKPWSPNNPNEKVYYPCQSLNERQYTEIVVFDSAALLPRYLVELQPTLVKPMPSVSSSAYSGIFFTSVPREEEVKQPGTQYNKLNVLNN